MKSSADDGATTAGSDFPPGARPGSNLWLPRLLQLASAASPVGSFAHSEGLEYAVHCGDVHDAQSTGRWIEGLAVNGILGLDAPLLVAMHRDWREDRVDGALARSAWLLACRETAELRLADRAQGQALMKIVAALAPDPVMGGRDDRMSYACAFAHAGARLGIPEGDTAMAYAHAWLENMVLCAVKLVPIGQLAGQRLLFDIAATLASGLVRAKHVDIMDIAAGAPGQAIVSALHETQATRLFRT